MSINLNKVDPVDDGFLKLDDNKIENQVASISSYFRNLKDEIISNINKADAVFGCVAWLTHKEIIDALVRKENVSIVVSEQSAPNKMQTLKKHRNWLKLAHLENKNNAFFAFLNQMYVGVEEPSSDNEIDSVRKIIPRALLPTQNLTTTNDQNDLDILMHNKFLVFAKIGFTKEVLQEISIAYYANTLGARTCDPKKYLETYATPVISPYAVWTGSYNFTAHSENHFENGLYICNEKIAEHYLNEFLQIYMLSRPLDFNI